MAGTRSSRNTPRSRSSKTATPRGSRSSGMSRRSARASPVSTVSQKSSLSHVESAMEGGRLVHRPQDASPKLGVSGVQSRWWNTWPTRIMLCLVIAAAFAGIAYWKVLVTETHPTAGGVILDKGIFKDRAQNTWEREKEIEQQYSGDHHEKDWNAREGHQHRGLVAKKHEAIKGERTQKAQTLLNIAAGEEDEGFVYDGDGLESERIEVLNLDPDVLRNLPQRAVKNSHAGRNGYESRERLHEQSYENYMEGEAEAQVVEEDTLQFQEPQQNNLNMEDVKWARPLKVGSHSTSHLNIRNSGESPRGMPGPPKRRPDLAKHDQYQRMSLNEIQAKYAGVDPMATKQREDTRKGGGNFGQRVREAEAMRESLTGGARGERGEKRAETGSSGEGDQPKRPPKRVHAGGERRRPPLKKVEGNFGTRYRD